MKENVPVISLVVAIIALAGSVVAFMQARDRAGPNISYETRIASLQRDLQQQRFNFENFRRAFRTLTEFDALSGRRKFVGLDPASKAYARIDTDNGFFLVSCQDVRPYLDGHKVILRIGNPLGVRFLGFKITQSENAS